jgi:hypothetical protein
MTGGVIVRQAAIGEVCASAPKSALCSAVAFNQQLRTRFGHSERELPLFKAIKGAIIVANSWNRANVGSKVR